jgi:dihydrofolate reductase
MIISLIAWMAQNRTIWKENKLPWNYPEDLKYFKKTTNGHPIIMWLNTYNSIWKPLPNRRNIVLTRQDLNIDWIDTFNSIPKLLENLKTTENNNEIFIIWWANIYKQFIPLADKIYLTQIKKNHDWDTFFPEFEANFTEISREKHDELDFIIYDRK